jgi:hypothetical protein
MNNESWLGFHRMRKRIFVVGDIFFLYGGPSRGGPRVTNFKILNENPLLVIHQIIGLKERSTLVHV